MSSVPIQTEVFNAPDAFYKAAESLIRISLQHETEAPAAVMISGGSTPIPLFDLIAADPFTVQENARILYSDDRHVPADSLESNFGVSWPMLEALQLSESQVIHVEPDLSLEEAAEKYDADLAAFFEAGGTIPIAFLGMGTDGHTCSLFTQEDLEKSKDRLAIAVERKTPPNRVSVTPTVLERAERIIFLMRGADKAAVVEQLLAHPDELIAGRAIAGCRHVEVWRV